MFWTLASLLGLWSLWRIWNFTIRPKLKPERPRELPYAIPWVGSAISFFRNSGATIYSGLEEPLRPIFTLTLAGESIYVVTNPKDVAGVYKNTTTLAFDSFIGDLMLACGATASTVKKMCEQPPAYPASKNGRELNPFNKSLVNLAIDFHHQQLLKGADSHEKEITDAFVNAIRAFLEWNRFSTNSRLVRSRTDFGVETSLLDFCGTILIEAGVKTYWGTRLWDADPKALDTFYQLDRGIWKILFQYPKFLSKEVIAVRDQIIDTIADYYRLPAEQRSDVAWFTKAMETESRAAGLDEDEMAACIMIIYFVINGNTYKFCFWTLCHILSDPTLLVTIRTEIGAEDRQGDPSIEHLTQHCPVLDSTLREVLRVYTSSASMRLALEDTVINGKVLRKGRKVMIPYRQLHENPAVWGEDASTFNARRFLNSPTLLRNSSYRPFGGGATLCAGRFVALAEVFMFIGLTLQRFEISIRDEPRQDFPRADTMKPTFGMMAPIEGNDFMVRICRRTALD